ncbi:MAG: hypothetical protein PHX08_01175 [Lachnospiraceae bacterium]|nr:hypothetical protein [Lachnospiraceae bacterium]
MQHIKEFKKKRTLKRRVQKAISTFIKIAGILLIFAGAFAIVAAVSTNDTSNISLQQLIMQISIGEVLIVTGYLVIRREGTTWER